MKTELQILDEYFKAKNIDSNSKLILPELNYNCLEWNSSNEWINRVYNGSILIINNQLRAYQQERFKKNQDEYKYSLVVIEENIQVFKWDLVQISKYDNRFNCQYLGEHNGSVIHIHKHELQTTILSYKNQILKRFHCASELINRKGDIISFERIQNKNKEKPVELIKLPELEKMDPISHNESIEMNLKPVGNFPIGYLNDK